MVAAPQGNVSNAELAARSHPAAVAPEQYTQAGAANANLQPLGPAAASDAQPKPEQQQPAAADSSSLVKVVRTAPIAAAAPVQSAGSQPIKSLPLSQMVAGAPGASGASGTSPAAKVPPKKAAAAAAKSFEQSEDEKFRQMMEEAEVSPLGPGRAAPFGSGQEAKRLFVLVPQEERQMEATAVKAGPGSKGECRFGRSVSHATRSSAVHGGTWRVCADADVPCGPRSATATTAFTSTRSARIPRCGAPRAGATSAAGRT